ncbi:C2 domain-containing protein 3-like isoform X2 [Brachyhypopomus gauderio]|uniref:C2 domain-containing protein 3-like isoform X2 n=1 Tax=Brachyhypopomus gauderio TaxID=698409 RepID=UPI004041E3FF
MKNKRAKSARFGSYKQKVVSDVSPSTSVPPLVEGQVRCFLRVTISKVLWTVAKPAPVTLVRLRWWGESSSGTLFCPRDGSLARQKAVKSTTRFPVRCGPKQFTSYLTDMGSLVLDVLTKPDHLPIARVQIAGIARLSLSQSINGCFTLVSPTSEKLGELQVTLALEALTETCGSSSSVPTTDMSTDAPVSDLLLPACSHVPPGGGGRESVGGGSNSTPRGKDHLYFQERGNVHFIREPAGKPDDILDQRDSLSAGSHDAGPSVNAKVQEAPVPADSPASLDLLSVLLERGSKLRNAMVISALKSDIDSDMALKDIPLPLPRDCAGDPPLLFSQAPVLSGPECTAHPHHTAVDLLLGSVNESVLPLWDGDDPPPDSPSGCSSLFLDSELGDPQYDQSLLENLFYKAPTDGRPTPAEDEKKSSGKNSRPDGDSGEHLGPTDVLPGLSVDRIALLGRIHLARVNILQLALTTDSTSNTSRTLSRKGRPPLPLTTKKCSYFVEYLFPFPSSDDYESGVAIPAKVTRVFSSKVVEGAVNFHQRSVFPVHFDGTSIKSWWDTNLAFRIYCRKSFQKKPVPIGTADLPLRSVLLCDGLTITTALPVQTQDNPGKHYTGPLKVSFELAADKKDFSCKSRSGKTSPQRPPSSQADMSAGTQGDMRGGDFLSVCEKNCRIDVSPRTVHPHHSVLTPRGRSRSASPRSGAPRSPHRPPRQPEEEQSDVLLHVLLMVPDGKDLNCTPLQPNVYLNCKLFGSEETRSTVSWGQTHPTFNLVQIAPLTLTSELLDRMRNNVMVIEVWLRASRSDHDQLLGLVKLPLHQFYMSFRDPAVSQLLFQARYPVVAVDSYVPVVDIFTGAVRGSLRVCLAMGVAQQITAFQRERNEEGGPGPRPARPAHQLDQRPAEDRKATTASAAASAVLTEHVFVVRVERVVGLSPLQSTVWGEADCYIHYPFPTQQSGDGFNTHIVESTLGLKSYRTATTLCVPDPVFGHCETHVLLTPPGVPVQTLLLSCLASQGLGSGGVQFEVWCRYYYPNVREQLVARGTLPVAKLCAMATMQGQGQSEAQLFSLPLVPRTDTPSQLRLRPSGLLEVSVQYKRRPVRSSGVSGAVTPREVRLLVDVHRATGLQAAARTLGLPYYSDVGLNSFVSVQLSFLPAQETRNTGVVARTFCPEFGHHTEFCCPLLVERGCGESVCLAELLQEATAVFTVHHRDTRQGEDAWRSRDSVLGLVRVQLADLLHKRTGVCGWYPLSPPSSLASECSLTSVGGLQLSVNLAQPGDRELLLRSAQLLGWEATRAIEEEEDGDEDRRDACWTHPGPLVLSVSVPRAWVPVPCLLLPGHTEIQRSTYCYYRYKLYDQEACYSRLSPPTLEGGGGEQRLATLAFPGSRTMELRRGWPLRWYLREERFEVQLWVSFGKGKRVRPHDSDRLVGSAFIDLSALAVTSKHKQTICGVYPVFKRSAADLGGAALRAHIAMVTNSTPYTAPPTNQEEVEQLSISAEEEEDRRPSSAQSHGPDGLTGQSHTSSIVHVGAGVSCDVGQVGAGVSSDVGQVSGSSQLTDDDSFMATVSVERAMHLSLKGCPLAERDSGLPSCCVSYTTSDASGTVTTAVVRDSACPVWDHQQDCRLSTELLVDPQQLLVFKVWHKGDVERVIGFASVDLSPLLSGFQSVCGWYNITDFGGQCQGQLKVSVSPLVGVQQHRPQRQAAYENSAPDSSSHFSGLPLCYQTMATYGSFPCHLSQFSEQRIISSPEHLPQLSARSVVTDRLDEHVENIQHFHQAVQQGESSTLPPPTGDTQPSSTLPPPSTVPSSTVLFKALRKNLSELDDIQRYFSRKLSTPVFSGPADLDHHPREDEHAGLMDSPQLQLTSNQLLGDDCCIIEGPSNHHNEAASSNFHWDHTTLAAQTQVYVFTGEDNLIPAESESSKTEACSQRDPETRQEDISALTSPAPEESTISSIPEDLHQDQCFTEDEEKGESELEEDEEFEETLIEPRPLNEVTSVTDRTSPWTSVMSVPDLGSLESVEAVEPPAGDWTSPPQEKQRDSVMVPPASSRPPSSEHSYSDLSDGFESEEAAGSRPCMEHSDEEEAVTSGVHEDSTQGIQQTLHHDQQHSVSDSDDSPLPLSTGPSTMTGAVQSVKLCDAAEIPNFFLPSHHLEASLRALRLAPVFPSGTVKSDCTYRRSARPKARVLPSSAKREETERIAKIFASHFTEQS